MKVKKMRLYTIILWGLFCILGTQDRGYIDVSNPKNQTQIESAIGETDDQILFKKTFILASAKNNAAAQYELGLLYERGRGVALDYKASFKWYRKSAYQGHNLAEYSLALLYLEGQGVRQNYSEAALWFKKASFGGHVEAKYGLALLYSKGQLADEDKKLTAYWMKKAADEGLKAAQYSVALLYEKGEGVRADTLKAYMYFRLAEGGGYKGAYENRLRLRDNMSNWDIRNANRMLAKWTEDFYIRKLQKDTAVMK